MGIQIQSTLIVTPEVRHPESEVSSQILYALILIILHIGFQFVVPAQAGIHSFMRHCGHILDGSPPTRG